MRLSTPERTSPAPFCLEQHASGTATALGLALMLPLAVAMLTPFALVAAASAGNPAVQATLAAKPALLAQIALGLAFWGLLFGWPLKRLLEDIASRRKVRIVGGLVTITDAGLFTSRTTEVPLGEYAGVQHRIRATISGLHHELYLTHTDSSRSVLLLAAPRIGAADIDRISALIGVAPLGASQSMTPVQPGLAGTLAAAA
jgi:hypothetical protein